MKDFFDHCAAKWDSFETLTETDIEKLLEPLGDLCDLKVLDIACGTGIIDNCLVAKGAKVTAIDLSAEMIKTAKKKHIGQNIVFISGDFYDFKQQGFDLAVIFNAYPHFLDKERLAKKLSEVLKPGGLFFVIHSQKRGDLNKMHMSQEKTARISSWLKDPEGEAKPFLDFFKIIKTKDDSSGYLLAGQKKSI